MEKVAEKTDKKISKYLGYKFFINKSENEVELLRIIKISTYNNIVTVRDEDTKSTREIKFDDLKSYTPLEPVGFVSFAKVGLYDENKRLNFDVIVSLYRLLDVKMNINEPYAICRQSINDFFYDYINNNPEVPLAGVSCSRDDCPVNLPYYILAACDEVIDFTMVHFYLDDTVDDLLEFINTSKYDKVLNGLFIDHMRAINPIYNVSGEKRKSHEGWCRDLKTLLLENNFQNDMDTMRNVSSVDFAIDEYLDTKVEKDIEVSYLKPELLKFISNTFKINIKPNAIAIKFDVDVDLGEFNNLNYVLIRDNKHNTYIISYVVDGEFRESDLVEEELSGLEKMHMRFYNKYDNQK